MGGCAGAVSGWLADCLAEGRPPAAAAATPPPAAGSRTHSLCCLPAGLSVRAFTALFGIVAAEAEAEAAQGVAPEQQQGGPPRGRRLAVSMLEVYNEGLRDLLGGSGAGEGGPKLDVSSSFCC